jgi:hypothetical protein
MLTEANSVEKTGYKFTKKHKWAILTVVGLCQTSMSKWLSSLLSLCNTDCRQITTQRSTPTQ